MRHLRTYRAIRLILREGSIRKAAEILAISPSALNRSILAFEDELGIEIFDRLPGGVVPSVAGELLFRHLDEHLSRMDDFVSFISEMKGGAAGALRLSVSGDLVDSVLPPVLARLRAAHPGLTVDCVDHEGPDLLAARAVDLALVTRPQTEPGIEVILSHPARVIGRVAAGHPTAGRALPLADLLDHALILPPAGGVRDAVEIALRRARLTPRARHVHPRPLAALALGAVPDVQAVLWRDAALPPSDGGPIAHVELTPLRVPPVQITLLHRATGAMPRAAALFRALLHAALDAG